MLEPVDLGLDFGSIFFRAAYMLDHEVVPVPIPDVERTWSGAVFTAGPQATKPFLFESLKSSLNLAEQSILFGLEGKTVTDRVHELLTIFKARVEDYAGCTTRRVVIAVPGYYLESQQATIRRIAGAVGFKQVELISDCQAAALGYTTLTPLEQTLHLLVFSMGFMGFEVSLVRLDQAGCHKIEERGGFDPSGRDIDRLLMETCVAQAEQRNTPLSFINSHESYIWLEFREVVEDAKKRLSLGEDIQITLPASVTNKFPLPILLQVADFEAAVQGYVDQAMATVSQVLTAGQTTPAAVDKVLLVGGSTRLPSFQAGLKTLFGPTKLIQPRENLLARGAAVYAAEQDKIVKSRPTVPLYAKQKTSRQSQSKIQNPPTPEAILKHAQTLAEAGKHEAATEYLTHILVTIQMAQIRIEKQRTD